MTQNDVLQVYTSKLQKLKQGKTAYKRVTSTHGYQLIDTCPIRPLRISNDDTVSNGFALCPNLHRAYDRGIIGIDEKYRVVVSRHFKEDTAVSYSLNALAGTQLYLPMPKTHFPKVEIFCGIWGSGLSGESLMFRSLVTG